MFAKLITTLLFCCSAAAAAYVAPMEFESIESAKAWFAKSYPSYEMRKETLVNTKKEKDFVYAFYGPRGSGVIRAEGWYYSCSPGYCGLCAMLKFEPIKSVKDEPKIYLEGNHFVIRAGDDVLLKIKLNTK